MTTATRAPRITEPNGDPALATALADFLREAVKCRELDVVVDEMVRLRCARQHDCRLCQTVRTGDAVRAGLDDQQIGKIDFYESSDLDERAKAALRVVDWFITRPVPADTPVLDPARAQYRELELADLCVHIARNSSQKIMVALGIDGTDHLDLDEDGHSYFDYDAEGTRTTTSRPDT